MELFVDQQKMPADTLEAGTLEDLLKQIQTRLCQPGQMVVKIRCNGEDVLPGEMEPTMREPTSAFDTLEVFTSTRGTLVTEAMQQARASLEETEAECVTIASRINEGKIAEAIESLGACLKVWQQVHEAVCRCIEVLKIDVKATELDGKTLEELITGPKEVLLQIKQALVAQDHVLLADVLRYEFEDVSAQWQRAITFLEQRGELE